MSDVFESMGHANTEEQEPSGRMSARASTRKRTLESLGQRSPSLRIKRVREDRVTHVDASSAFSPSEESEHSETDAPQRRNDKGCRCGRTKCLKQYCACFRNDIRCTTDCVCRDCNNDGLHEETRMKAVRMTRLNDPTAFKGTELELDSREVLTPRGTLKTVRGCRCRRSKCQKKYCECYGAGLLCGSNCVCEDCLNFEPHDKSQGGHEAAPIKYAKYDNSFAQRKPTREEAQAVAQRSAALASRRPLISVQVNAPASQPVQPTGAKQKRAPAPVADLPEPEVEADEEEPPEWEDNGDLQCETLLSARSTMSMSDPLEGTKGMPLQARDGWEAEDERGRQAAEFADEPRFGLLKERSTVFSPGPGAYDFAPMSRNMSGNLGEEIPSMSRNASGFMGLSRFESMDWANKLTEELESVPADGFHLARQFSNDISGLLA
mmetsp:Transcript_13511/g.32210  ORF Transcript_13511/g.32210 Transcript_13511/m.32210 type:complete len:436 (-) Transcript_13511:100-1407(-)